MAGKRRYEDACAAAHALDLVGERWALLVARELMLGPRRFTDLRAGLPGISPNVLTQRLEELEKAAIVRRRKLPPPASVRVYELTDWGLELEPVLQAIGRWAARSPVKPDGLPISVNSLILSFRTMFNAEAARGFTAEIELRLADAPFRVRIGDGRLEAMPGPADAPAAVIESDPNALAAVVYGGRDLAEALRAGDLRIEGDVSVVARFATLFPLPDRAPAAT